MPLKQLESEEILIENEKLRHVLLGLLQYDVWTLVVALLACLAARRLGLPLAHQAPHLPIYHLPLAAFAVAFLFWMSLD